MKQCELLSKDVVRIEKRADKLLKKHNSGFTYAAVPHRTYKTQAI